MFALPLRKLLIFESHVSGYTLEIFQVENFEGVTSEGEADVCIHQNTQNKSAVSYAIDRTANEATPQSSNLEEVNNSIPSQGSSVLYMYTKVSKKPSDYFLLFDTHYTFITYTLHITHLHITHYTLHIYHIHVSQCYCYKQIDFHVEFNKYQSKNLPGLCQKYVLLKSVIRNRCIPQNVRIIRIQ